MTLAHSDAAPPGPTERVGRPRDARLHHAILDATRELLTAGSYADLSMESVAAHAGVGKKTLYRRWPSKAPMVAEAVLEAYGGSGSFPVAQTGDIRADLRSWLNEHAEFLAEPANAALVRALVAAAVARPGDGEDLYEQLSAPQLAGLTTRLRRAVEDRELRAGADVDAVAHALVGALLFHALTSSGAGPGLNGLVDALLDGVTGY
ncbi:TetR/AcrR family transcriptional regulator [Mycobacterium shigaense]|uniref:TetR family transcriptional regulator n=1 Tax=Mycobacterium shigaense TaxID=722731 RepID=A0A1Z4ENQ4_9MYCO|nr:TetR/AcrR family transcriptional regulator [Mycobacterium shigaense]MEA1120431.1 TetR/AcrR family transcriptional regulator [Mycobacterium shigaense]PRI14325.1 TetR family transcriptional regulator [Mycobacterium shigaense]BAX94506.1 TetR family transcriptional regulator [Mycobacterium shigaense]